MGEGRNSLAYQCAIAAKPHSHTTIKPQNKSKKKMNKNICDAAQAVAVAGRKPYQAPASVVVELEGDASLMSMSDSAGWTTSDRAHGKGLVEEDANNPYSDADF